MAEAPVITPGGGGMDRVGSIPVPVIPPAIENITRPNNLEEIKTEQSAPETTTGTEATGPDVASQISNITTGTDGIQNLATLDISTIGNADTKPNKTQNSSAVTVPEVTSKPSLPESQTVGQNTNVTTEKDKLTQWREDFARKKDEIKQDPLYQKVYQKLYNEHKTFYDEGYGLLSLETTALYVYEDAKLNQEKGMDTNRPFTRAEQKKALKAATQKIETQPKDVNENKKPSFLKRLNPFARGKVRENIPSAKPATAKAAA